MTMYGDKSENDPYPMRLLTVGDTMNPTTYDQAVTLLACWLLRPSDVDAYALWVVLCFRPNDPFRKFVVWEAYDRPEGWALGHGDYYATLNDAVKRYEERGGRYALDEYGLDPNA